MRSESIMTRRCGLVGLLLVSLALGCGTPAGGPGRVDQLLGRLAGYGYSGTIAVLHHGRPLHEAAYGYADAERGVPMSTEARFDIGSLTKPFTAALVLSLEEDGSLSTDDSLGAVLPDVPSDKAGLTIHELLTHTSGLIRSAASLGITEASTRAEFLDAVLESELLFEPGERFEYSDTGYDLLAAIVEQVTGRDWSFLLETRVLEPAGLRVTGYAANGGLSSDAKGPLAWSHSAPLGVPWPETREGPSPASWFNRGSGGLVSTASELAAWADALWNGKILSPASLARMTSPQVSVGDGRSYGYGWFVTSSDHGRVIYHGGDIAGYKAHLAHYVDEGLIFAVLHSVAGWERVTDQYAIAAWFGEGPVPPPPAIEAEDLERLAGTYRVGESVMVAWPEAGRLAVEADGETLVGALFASAGTGADERTKDARAVVEALQRQDLAALQSRLRDRDLAAGMGRRLIGIWSMLARRFGAAEGWEVLASQPAQDGTVVSVVRTHRGDRSDLMRFVWRGDRLVAVGGDEGLRRPTAVFVQTGKGQAARFEPATGRTTLLDFEPVADPDRVEIRVADRALTALRDRATSIDPPGRSLVRELLPVVVRRGVSAGMKEYERLVAAEPDRIETGESALNSLGYALLHMRATDRAIGVFSYVVEENPESWNAWDSLGEAQLAAGDTTASRASYTRSLRLNPDNDVARRMVEGFVAPLE